MPNLYITWIYFLLGLITPPHLWLPQTHDTNLHFLALDDHRPNGEIHSNGVLLPVWESPRLEVLNYRSLAYVRVSNQDDLEKEIKRVIMFRGWTLHGGGTEALEMLGYFKMKKMDYRNKNRSCIHKNTETVEGVDHQVPASTTNQPPASSACLSPLSWTKLSVLVLLLRCWPTLRPTKQESVSTHPIRPPAWFLAAACHRKGNLVRNLGPVHLLILQQHIPCSPPPDSASASHHFLLHFSPHTTCGNNRNPPYLF